jgi:porin
VDDQEVKRSSRHPRRNSRNRKRNGDVGYYLNLDQLVWKETDNPKDAQGLGMFMRYGYAPGDVNRLEHFWSVGAQYAGLIPTRDKDVLGFGVGQGILSRQFRSQMNSRADRETVYEAYYAIEITPWMHLTPDIQIITNPGGTKDARDSIVGTVRVRIIF